MKEFKKKNLHVPEEEHVFIWMHDIQLREFSADTSGDLSLVVGRNFFYYFFLQIYNLLYKWSNK
jgi:hypothetical protein